MTHPRCAITFIRYAEYVCKGTVGEIVLVFSRYHVSFSKAIVLQPQLLHRHWPASVHSAGDLLLHFLSPSTLACVHEDPEQCNANSRASVLLTRLLVARRDECMMQYSSLLRAFVKLRKATISFPHICPSVRLSACNSLRLDDFLEVRYVVFLEYLSRTFKFHYNLTRITSILLEEQFTF